MDTTLHIDYLSISTPMAAWGALNEATDGVHDYAVRTAFCFFAGYPTFLDNARRGVRNVFAGGAGFKHRVFFATYGWSFFHGAGHGRTLLQLPGEACHALRRDTDSEGESIGLNPLLESPFNRITRIDVAASFRIPDDPLAIASLFKKKKPLDFSQINSETGRTVYIGAPTSEVHCRVYRYAPPHPRSEWLRIEFVLKGNHALRAQERIPIVGLEPIMKGLLASWGFEAPNLVKAIVSGVEAEKLAYQRRQKAGSLRWLYSVAIPALKTALDTGIATRPDVEALLWPKSLE